MKGPGWWCASHQSADMAEKILPIQKTHQSTGCQGQSKFWSQIGIISELMGFAIAAVFTLIWTWQTFPTLLENKSASYSLARTIFSFVLQLVLGTSWNHPHYIDICNQLHSWSSSWPSIVKADCDCQHVPVLIGFDCIFYCFLFKFKQIKWLIISEEYHNRTIMLLVMEKQNYNLYQLLLIKYILITKLLWLLHWQVQ